MQKDGRINPIYLDEGKYIIVEDVPHKFSILRCGEPWIQGLHDVPGSKAWLSLIIEYDELRDKYNQLLENVK